MTNQRAAESLGCRGPVAWADFCSCKIGISYFHVGRAAVEPTWTGYQARPVLAPSGTLRS